MSDALTAASLLLAALALIYSAWSTSIDAAISQPLSPNAKAKAREQAEIRKILTGRARPLSITAWLIALVFAPRSYELLATAAICAGPQTCNYNDVGAIFLLTQLVVLALALHLTARVRDLGKQVRG
jgi:hypothetical protein